MQSLFVINTYHIVSLPTYGELLYTCLRVERHGPCRANYLYKLTRRSTLKNFTIIEMAVSVRTLKCCVETIAILIYILFQLSGIRGYSIAANSDKAKYVSVPTHHQRLGRDRISIPELNGFFWYPRRIRKYSSRDLFRDDCFQGQYVIYYTFDPKTYNNCSEAIESRLLERWYGEIIVFRRGRGGGDIVSLDRRRGDTDRIIWQVIER